jgi:UDP-N-acetylmuramyl pentapeptide phosphotransferase/UDP-N-acetylglucosamine-1-phosphate transferase
LKTLIPQIATIAILCLLLINAARSYAGKLNLIDRPAGRKQHVGEIPTVGGLAIYCAFFLGTSLDYGLFSAYAALLTAMGFLVVVGALDDAMDVSPFAKLAAQAISAAATSATADRLGLCDRVRRTGDAGKRRPDGDLDPHDDQRRQHGGRRGRAFGIAGRG